MIIDASVAFKWIVHEDGSEAALGLLESGDLHAPILLMHEVANGLWKKATREQIDPTVSFAPEIEQLSRMIRLWDEADHAARAFELAQNLVHPVYDCVYLAMAEASHDVLITADQRFLRTIVGTGFAEWVRALG